MLDLAYVREHMEEVERALAARGEERSLDDVRELDRKRRDLLVRVEELKKLRNVGSKQIGQRIRSGGDVEALKQEVREIGERISAMDRDLAEVEGELAVIMQQLPNLPHPDVPGAVGKHFLCRPSPKNNPRVEIRALGVLLFHGSMPLARMRANCIEAKREHVRLSDSKAGEDRPDGSPRLLVHHLAPLRGGASPGGWALIRR